MIEVEDRTQTKIKEDKALEGLFSYLLAGALNYVQYNQMTDDEVYYTFAGLKDYYARFLKKFRNKSEEEFASIEKMACEKVDSYMEKLNSPELKKELEEYEKKLEEYGKVTSKKDVS